MSFLLRSFCFLFFFSSFLNTFASPTRQLCRPEQRNALLQFESEFESKRVRLSDFSDYCYPKMNSWRNTSDCCYWDGITCEAMSGEVIELDLSSSCVHGQLSSTSSLFKLKKLHVLNLAYNNFSSSVLPSQFNTLLELRQLNLSESVFSGRIPVELLHLTKLVSLDLSTNYLSAERSFLSKLVQNLTNLLELSLSSVDISSEIPQKISNLSSLVMLNLSSTSLSGNIPDLGNLSHLSTLDLSDNLLNGHIPSFLGNLYHLTFLALSFNRFHGQIPSSFANLEKLTTLHLEYNTLSGNFPSQLLNLTKLEYLSVNGNHFGGTLPPNINALSHLKSFRAYGNTFTGTLPSALFDIPTLTSVILSNNQLNDIHELGNSSSPSKLERLFLGGNNFRGSIPVSISRLVNLEKLDLSYFNTGMTVDFGIFWQLKGLTYLDLSYLNTTTTVNLSIVFSHLKSLSYLDLSGVQVSTANVCSVSNLPSNLVALVLSGCGITEFPNFSRKLEYMESLDLSNNKLKGQVPQWLWKHPRLTYLILSGNSFTGLEKSSNDSSGSIVYFLDLSSNAFQGPLVIPPVSTQAILVSNNNFAGKIPQSICEQSNLGILDLSNNSFIGSIPRCLRNLNSHLEVLNLSNNQLSGNIPEIFTNATALTSVDVSNNRLVGTLPRSLKSCSGLQVLNIRNNGIDDTFPFWFNSLRYLKVLVLRSNKFKGVLHRPRRSFGFPNLQIVDVANNYFTGILPSYYFADWNMTTSKDFNGFNYIGPPRSNYYHDSMVLVSKGVEMRVERIFTLLTAIDFSGNRLRGQIPESIGLLKDLIVLNLSNNGFSGNIPSSLANLIELESLDLSHNQLSGQIPPALGYLTNLSNITVSHNQLVGPIPQTAQFQTQSASSFEGNRGLCGLPLSEKCGHVDTETPQEAEAEEEEDEEEGVVSWTAVYIALTPGVILGLTIGYIVMLQKPHWFVNK